jgi:peptide/nickel transport system substrate-binding protein
MGLLAVAAADSAAALKRGGVLRLYDPNNPGNMSMLESPTIASQMPLMGVYNNLIMFDQHKPQVSVDTIVPDLVTSWS